TAGGDGGTAGARRDDAGGASGISRDAAVDEGVAIDGQAAGDQSGGDGKTDGAAMAAMCVAGLRDGTTACTPGRDAACVKPCGPDGAGSKPCTCDPARSVYACGMCAFAAGRDYACYK